MAQADYRITDAIMDPPDIADNYTENSIHLASGCACYRPPDGTPPVGPLPALRNGYVTFGVFNNRLKMNGKVFPLWSQILQQMPDARLVLKFPGGSDEALVRDLLQEMAAAGIERDRVTVYPLMPLADPWALYNSIDIALDTYPFNGCITTQEGLWMGVPVVTLSGQRFTSHYGDTMLQRLGLEFFVSTTEAQYVAKAVTLARQTDSLAQIRASLRTRLLNSPMMDYAGYVKQLEQAYRRMWRDYCGTHGAEGGDATP
jgi:predicted O-linked N-acetylglucosamine transferase (SPINDLY family)